MHLAAPQIPMSDVIPPQVPPSGPAVSSKRVIKRIAPLQAGKVLAILYGIMGVIFLPLFLLVATLGSALPAEERGGMMAFGAGMMLLMPIFYAVAGFVFGVVGAALYNVISKWVGGFEVEVA